ncbi:HD domain-containing phosphohydrolase [Alkaliphilus sp. B6464]|uniref:HD domain-containing phosphohydrolase n=1 Tax=Alkaliphilus sp. B6464 TaxID=2731219 RepID=UPI001BAD4007|nr:HD domain-containing phosphohydrolase [Alkaliphilus sp. B6464]QUH20128.1 HD domain-containing protein [Alkaliphilus sp. B6464]
MINFKKLKIENIVKCISCIAVISIILFATINFTVIKSLNERSNITEEIFSRYVVFSIAIVMVLLALLVFALIFIRRIVNTDIPYILRSFKNLSNFSYDVATVDSLVPYFSEEKDLKRFVGDVFREQIFLQEIKNIAANEYVLDDVLEKILKKLNAFVRVDRIGVAFVDYEKRRIVAETGKMNYGNVLLGPGFEVSMDQTSLTEMLISKKPVFSNDLVAELNKKKSRNRSLDLIVNEGIKSNMILPLIIGDKVFGFLFFSSFEKGSYNKKSLRIGENIANAIATIIDQTYLTKKMLNNITLTFADLVEKKDLETGNHINRMTNYSKVIAEGLLNYENENYRVNNSFVYDMELYAPLHDIGKIGIPDKILGKPARLTAEEWMVMKEHTNIGANILSNLRDSLKIFRKEFYQMAIDVTRYHHEKWDGKGYPYGLKGEEIPLAARIVAVADVFDALSSRRPYKEPIPFDSAVDIIKDGSGTHFDPVLVGVFIDNLPQIRKIYDRDFGNNNFNSNKILS